eukprot:751621-Hanusia_phi.AAC.2
MGVVSSARYERVVCVVLLSISTLVLPSSSLTWRRIYSDVYSLPACSQGVRRATHLIGGAVRGASVVEGAGVVEGRLPALRLRGGSNAERDEDDDAPPRPPVDEYPPPSEGGDPRPEYGRGGRRDDKDLEEAHRTDYGDSWRNRNEDDEGERADYRRGGRARGYRYFPACLVVPEVEFQRLRGEARQGLRGRLAGEAPDNGSFCRLTLVRAGR